MTLSRRRFLSNLLAAPVVIRTPGLLMPVRPVWPTLDQMLWGGSEVHRYFLNGIDYIPRIEYVGRYDYFIDQLGHPRRIRHLEPRRVYPC